MPSKIKGWYTTHQSQEAIIEDLKKSNAMLKLEMEKLHVKLNTLRLSETTTRKKISFIAFEIEERVAQEYEMAILALEQENSKLKVACEKAAIQHEDKMMLEREMDILYDEFNDVKKKFEYALKELDIVREQNKLLNDFPRIVAENKKYKVELEITKANKVSLQYRLEELEKVNYDLGLEANLDQDTIIDLRKKVAEVIRKIHRNNIYHDTFIKNLEERFKQQLDQVKDFNMSQWQLLEPDDNKIFVVEGFKNVQLLLKHRTNAAKFIMVTSPVLKLKAELNIPVDFLKLGNICSCFRLTVGGRKCETVAIIINDII